MSHFDLFFNLGYTNTPLKNMLTQQQARWNAFEQLEGILSASTQTLSHSLGFPRNCVKITK